MTMRRPDPDRAQERKAGLARSVVFASILVASLALVADRAHADRPDAGGASRLCDDAASEDLDLLCSVGAEVRSAMPTCISTPISACSMNAPAFADFSCRFPDGFPERSTMIALSWTSGDLVAQPPLADQPDATIAALSLRITEPTDAAIAATLRRLGSRLDALGCERGRATSSTVTSFAAFRCGEIELSLRGSSLGSSRSVSVVAGIAAYFDCWDRATAGARPLPRFGAESVSLFELPLAEITTRCDRRDAAACDELSARYSTGRTVRRDLRRGLRLARRACDLGSVRGCSSVGYAYDEGRGVPRDRTRARAIYEDACSRGGASSCARLGQMYERGIDVTADDVRASAYWARGCSFDDGFACRIHGRRVRDGVGGPADRDAARDAFHRGCTAGDGECCLDICSVEPDYPGCEHVRRLRP